MLNHCPVQLRGAGACVSQSHCAFRRVPLGLGGCVSPGTTLELWERKCQLPEPQETWRSDVVKSAVGGQPRPLRSPAHLPHRQSSLSLSERKLEGVSSLQRAWRAPRLSHQMTTGDSEPALICIHFASHLHRTLQPAKPTRLYPPPVGVGRWRGTASRSFKRGEGQGACPGLRGVGLALPRSSVPRPPASRQRTYPVFSWESLSLLSQELPVLTK